MPNEVISPSESIWTPKGLATPNLRARAPSRPSKVMQASRHSAPTLGSVPVTARKMAVMPSSRLLSVHA